MHQQKIWVRPDDEGGMCFTYGAKPKSQGFLVEPVVQRMRFGRGNIPETKYPVMALPTTSGLEWNHKVEGVGQGTFLLSV